MLMLGDRGKQQQLVHGVEDVVGLEEKGDAGFIISMARMLICWMYWMDVHC